MFVHHGSLNTLLHEQNTLRPPQVLGIQKESAMHRGLQRRVRERWAVVIKLLQELRRQETSASPPGTEVLALELEGGWRFHGREGVSWG